MKFKIRVILIILSIAWGTFAITTMLAIGEGLKNNFAQVVANTGENLLIVTGGRTTKFYQGKSANQKINLTEQDLASLQNLPEIKALSSQYVFTPSIYYQDKQTRKQISAVSSDYAKMHSIKIMPGGRFISPLDIKNSMAVIVLGTQTKQELFPHLDNPVGEKVIIADKTFVVIGVMQEKSQFISQQQPDSLANWIPTTIYKLLFNPQQIDSIDVTYQDLSQIDSLQQHIQQIIALNHGANPLDDNIVHFRNYAKRQERINNFFFGMQIFLGIVGALTLIIAGVGTANVMYAAVNRETRNIGVKMAIGARTWQIMRPFLLETLQVTFSGGLLGLILASLVVFGLQKIPMHGKIFTVIGQPKPELSFSVIFVVVLVFTIIGLLAGLLPALKATKIDPVEALAHE